MMEMSEQIGEIATAFAKAQSEITHATKDGSNPHFKSRYATLSSVMEACRAPLTKNGLSLIQGASTSDGAVVVTTQLTHSSGQWFRDSIACRPDKQTIQGIGSAITYMRRYAAMAMIGIAPDDDDGEAAMGRNDNVTTQAPPRPQRDEYSMAIPVPSEGETAERWKSWCAKFKATAQGLADQNDVARLVRDNQPQLQNLRKIDNGEKWYKALMDLVAARGAQLQQAAE